MNYNNSKFTIYLPLIIAVSIIGGIVIGLKIKTVPHQSDVFLYPRTDKLYSVVKYIQEEYVDTVKMDKLTEEAIDALLENLDPHSVYIPASELQTMNEPLEGGFFGIGVQFNMQNDTVIIINTIPNGPSALLGILPGDRIVKVDGKNVAGIKLPSDEVVKKLKGPKGTKVVVSIMRRNTKKLLDFEIIRNKIPLYSIDASYMIDSTIGYLKINQFGRTTYDEFIEAINKLKPLGMTKLILDLRGNGGGYLDAATRIADEFLTKGKLIVYTQGKARPRQNVYATDKGICEKLQLEILIDEFSASASEILAGAIQDNDRGLIIGRRSFGKGLVQEQTSFTDGSGLRLTIARYYTPTGRSIQKPYNKGVDEYNLDLSKRYSHGEFESRDSIHFNDSLKFTTPGGKTVYGGGGIMPDNFIPADTNGYSRYLVDIRDLGLIYKFAFEYTDNNRAMLNKMKSYEELVLHLEKINILKQFVTFAEKQGIKKNAKEIAVSKTIMEVQLKAYIARNIFDNEGYYPIIATIDSTLIKAIEVLKNDKGL